MREEREPACKPPPASHAAQLLPGECEASCTGQPSNPADALLAEAALGGMGPGTCAGHNALPSLPAPHFISIRSEPMDLGAGMGRGDATRQRLQGLEAVRPARHAPAACASAACCAAAACKRCPPAPRQPLFAALPPCIHKRRCWMSLGCCAPATAASSAAAPAG